MGNDFYHSLFSALVTYVILSVVRNPVGTKIIWFWSFGYMMASHIYIVYTNYMGWSVDFTIVQMVFTLKFCALACNLQDGSFPSGEVSSIHKRYAIQSPPSPLEYISYLYYWCTILPGPFFEFNDYIAFINRSMFSKTNGNIPEGSLKAFLKIWFKLLFVIGGIILSFTYHPSFLWKDTEYAMSLDLVSRWTLVMVSFFFMRSTYYTGWLMSEAAVVLTGFGFNGYDKQGNSKWDRVTNVDILGVEFGGSLKQMIAAWNQGTAHWLKVYVYFRVTKPRPKEGQNPKELKGLTAPQGQLVVFVVSAMWHGCYPGYYYFFVFEFFTNYIGAYFAKRLTPLIPNHPVVQKIYFVFCFVVSMSALNYGACCFVALSHEGSMIVLRNTYYLGLIFTAILFAFAIADPLRPKRKKE